MFLSIVLEQRIEARAERALNIGDYDANDVDGKANLGSSDDHDDDDDDDDDEIIIIIIIKTITTTTTTTTIIIIIMPRACPAEPSARSHRRGPRDTPPDPSRTWSKH